MMGLPDIKGAVANPPDSVTGQFSGFNIMSVNPGLPSENDILTIEHLHSN